MPWGETVRDSHSVASDFPILERGATRHRLSFLAAAAQALLRCCATGTKIAPAAAYSAAMYSGGSATYGIMRNLVCSSEYGPIRLTFGMCVAWIWHAKDVRENNAGEVKRAQHVSVISWKQVQSLVLYAEQRGQGPRKYYEYCRAK